MNPRGVVVRSSPYTVKETIDLLVIFLQQHGAIVYARINQQSELNNAGLKINPLEFILVGNPKAGGLIMIVNPFAALDLPLKIIAWEDEKNKIWVGYIETAYIEEKYSLPHSLMGALDLAPLINQALIS